MSKFSFKNPFDQTFDGYKEQAANHTNTATNTAAHKLFADKPYTAEHRHTYLLAIGLKIASNAISFVSAYFAAYYVFSLLMGVYIAFILSFATCLIIELLKNSLWITTAKNRMKYKVWAVGSLLVLVGLHLVSFGASVFGAYIAADYLPTEPSRKDSVITSDAALMRYDQQITAIDQQTAVLLTEKPNATTGKFSSTTKGIIENLAAQKNDLQTAKNKLLDQTTKANEEKAATAKESAAKAEILRNDGIKIYRWAAAVFAAFFELVFIICQIFIIRYLFRAYIDSQTTINTDTVTNDVTNLVTPEKIEPTEPNQRTPIGFKIGGVGSIGSCENCSKEFTKNSYTHKFCADTCRIEAWEKKNGKKLVGK